MRSSFQHYLQQNEQWLVSSQVPVQTKLSKAREYVPSGKATLLQYESKTSPEIRALYIDFMRKYRKLRHMALVKSEEDALPNRYYIPQLPVHCPESATTPLRVVFHASTSNRTSVSLNQALLNYPVLQPDWFNTLVKF